MLVIEFKRDYGDVDILPGEEWLTGLTRVDRDASLRLSIEQKMDQGVADATVPIGRLFDRTGVAYRLVDGKIVLS